MIDDPHLGSMDHASFAEYLDFAKKTEIPTDKWLTYEQFIGNVDETKENLNRIKLGFVPALPPAGSVDDFFDAIDAGLNMAQTVTEFVDRARRTLRRNSRTTMTASGRGGGGDGFIKVPNTFGDSGGGDGPGGSGTKASPFDIRRLNFGAKPTEVGLNTGIIPNTFGAHFMDADTTHAPLHVTQIKMRIPDSLDGKLYTFYEQVLAFMFANAAQMQVNFDILANQSLTADKLRNYLNAIMDALQIYYFYTSVIMFCDNPYNRNQGMLSLRAGMSAEDLDSLHQLHYILDGSPRPPNLDKMCFYLMQTYKESPLPGSALLKLMPIPFTTTTGTTFSGAITPGLIDTAITTLGGTAVRNTTGLIAKICPSWMTASLLAPVDNALHDLQFNTIWGNLPGIGFVGTTATRVPTAVSLSTPFTFNSHVDILDGAVYGLTTAYISTNWVPGLLDPESVYSIYSTTKYTNRLSFYNDTVSTAFHPACAFDKLAHSRGETFVIAANTTATGDFQVFGTEAALSVTGNSIRETAYKLFEWLMSIDLIGGGITRNPDNADTRNYKSRGRRGKPRRNSNRKDKE